MAMPFAAPQFTIADLDRFPDDGNRYELLGGQLLVTPAPGPNHQVVLGRLTMRLAAYLGPDGPAVIVTPGVIQLENHTQLEPDLLVIPTSLADRASWRRISGWWLAVEVSGRDSMVYDRDFKQDAYLRLGVREVWRVNLAERRVYRSRAGQAHEVSFADRLEWHPPELTNALVVEVPALFGRTQLG
jgi:Uma2 family endonuclease